MWEFFYFIAKVSNLDYLKLKVTSLFLAVFLSVCSRGILMLWTALPRTLAVSNSPPTATSPEMSHAKCVCFTLSQTTAVFVGCLHSYFTAFTVLSSPRRQKSQIYNTVLADEASHMPDMFNTSCILIPLCLITGDHLQEVSYSWKNACDSNYPERTSANVVQCAKLLNVSNTQNLIELSK